MGICQSQKVYVDEKEVEDEPLEMPDAATCASTKIDDLNTTSSTPATNSSTSEESTLENECKQKEDATASSLAPDLSAREDKEPESGKQENAEKSSISDDLTDADRKILLQYFERLDTEGTGFITEQQTRDLLSESGFITTNSVVHSIIEHFKFDGTSRIDFEKFLKIKAFCWKAFALNKQRACSVHIAMRSKSKKKRKSVRLIPTMDFMAKRSKHTFPKLDEFVALTPLLEECDGELSDEEGDESNNIDDKEVANILSATNHMPLPKKQEELLRELFDVYEVDNKITISDTRDLFAHLGFHCTNHCIRHRVGKICQERLTFDQFCMLKSQMRMQRLRAPRYSHSFNAVPNMKNDAGVGTPNARSLATSLSPIASPIGRTESKEEDEYEKKELSSPETGDVVESCFDDYKGDDGTVSSAVIRDCIASSGLKRESISQLISENGLEEDRRINLEEFRQLTKSASDGMKKIAAEIGLDKYTPQELEVQRKLFQRYDANDNGSIDTSELRDALGEIGWMPSSEKIKSIMGEIGGSENTREIGFASFLKLRDYVRRHFLESAVMDTHRPSALSSPIGSQASFRNMKHPPKFEVKRTALMSAVTEECHGSVNFVMEAVTEDDACTPLPSLGKKQNHFRPSNRRDTGMVFNGAVEREATNMQRKKKKTTLKRVASVEHVDDDEKKMLPSRASSGSKPRRATGMVANGSTAIRNKNSTFASTLGSFVSETASEADEDEVAEDEEPSPTSVRSSSGERPRRATGIVRNGDSQRKGKFQTSLGSLGSLPAMGEEEEEEEESECVS